jgi:hypothetical protein
MEGGEVERERVCRSVKGQSRFCVSLVQPTQPGNAEELFCPSRKLEVPRPKAGTWVERRYLGHAAGGPARQLLECNSLL